MSHQKKIYTNRQSRGGTSPKPTVSEFGSANNKNKSPKDYHRQAVAYHGSESNLEEFKKRLTGQ